MREHGFLADPSRSILGTFVSGGVTSLEILAWSGFDLVCIETEHAARDVGEVANLIRAADACGVPSLVRVQDLSEIGRVLDAGADGVVIPHVDTADDARACVEAVQYPPRGSRGLGPGRAVRHGLGRSAEVGPPATVLMIESARAVENAAEIASIAGVDALFIGPFDLASSMGVTPGTDDHTAAITRAIQDCLSVGQRAGVFCRDVDALARWAAVGATLFLLGGDHLFLAGAAASALKRGRETLDQREGDSAH